MPSKLEELAWISRCKLFNDEKAFGKLVDSYSGRIRRFFLLQTRGDEMLSDDLAQETFIKVWDRLPELSQIGSFSSWIYRIAYNNWIDYLRRQRLVEAVDNIYLADESAASDRIDSQDLQHTLYAALSRLSDPERISMTLFYLSELSIKEITAVTGMAEGTVRSHLTRGRAKLRQMPELTRLRNEK